MSIRISSEATTKYKKGELQLTVLAAKELPQRDDKKPVYVYCAADITGTTPQKTSAATTSDWNESLTFDIMTLEETEALVQVFGKFEPGKDRFLGQINIPIKVLELPSEPEWYYLSDRPGLLLHESSEIALKESTGSYVSGQVQLGFKFTHRLIRERTSRVPLGNLFEKSQVLLPSITPTELTDIQNIVATEAAMVENPDSCKSESVIVEESVKAKENLIYQTLSRKKKLVRTMSKHIEKLEKTQGKESVRIKKQEVEQFEKEIKSVESTLMDVAPPPIPPPPPKSRPLSSVASPTSLTQTSSPTSRPSTSSSPAPVYVTPLAPTPPPPTFAPPQPSLVNEVEFLRLKVELLQKELEKQQKVTDMVSLLVGKLEKLDKLDDILRRLDNMKVAPGGDGGGSESSYVELKAQLEELQKIIFDASGKYSEKEKEDANIRFEKTYTELAKTSEHREEVAKMKEEKRRINEPLNKEALSRMIKIYTPDAIRNNEEIKNKVANSPELAFIGMDPKAIQAKHQNDFAQYALLITEIDELRAIYASLPKFRNDQKRQLDFLETLENKIEQYMKDPPKPKKVAKPVKKLKVKKVEGGGDIFAELLAKRKQASATN